MAEIRVENGRFHLQNARMSYVFRVAGGRFLMQEHFGARLSDVRTNVLRRYIGVPESALDRNEFQLDRLPQEAPTFGYGDLREGLLAVRGEDGLEALDLRYHSYELLPEKPEIPGLPSAYDKTGTARSLRVTLTDDRLGLRCDLTYTVFDDCDVVARQMTLVNTGTQRLRVERAMSACLDLPTDRYRLLTLSGAWARERRMDWRMLRQGTQGVSSARGASSAQSSPFLALAGEGATETQGTVYAFTLVYSGNFRAEANVDQYGQTRVLLGLDDRSFSWLLEPGETFATPEAVLCYAADGLGGMSRSWHTLCQRHIVRGRYREADRPILLNNW
ncbi:MAG: alpha-galactosidase, partial [Opitutae bacterium]|nr:alpha-galactosidase [Opitutae bacterium]